MIVKLYIVLCSYIPPWIGASDHVGSYRNVVVMIVKLYIVLCSYIPPWIGASNHVGSYRNVVVMSSETKLSSLMPLTGERLNHVHPRYHHEGRQAVPHSRSGGPATTSKKIRGFMSTTQLQQQV